jgi:hypothetical protein
MQPKWNRTRFYRDGAEKEFDKIKMSNSFVSIAKYGEPAGCFRETFLGRTRTTESKIGRLGVGDENH